jgi:hypothetical protein
MTIRLANLAIDFRNRFIEMNRSSVGHVFAAVALIVAAATGCQKQAGDTKAKAAPAVTTKPTPEESFELIVETFRRGVEDVPFGFKVDDGSGGRTMMTGRNVVTHKLIPPAKEGEPLKAEIKVASKSQYSLQRSTEQPEADSEESEDATDTESTDDSDVQIFDPAVASTPGAGTDRRATTTKEDKSAVTVARRDDQDERTYELVYENGRWKLVTKLDPKTEELIKFAFDRALATQS